MTSIMRRQRLQRERPQVAPSMGCCPETATTADRVNERRLPMADNSDILRLGRAIVALEARIAALEATVGGPPSEGEQASDVQTPHEAFAATASSLTTLPG